MAKPKSAKKIQKKTTVKRVSKKTKKKKKTVKLVNKEKPVVSKRKPKKKVRHVRCLRVGNSERLYNIINSIQIKHQEKNIHILDEELIPIALNILKDAGIECTEHDDNGRMYLHLSPGEDTPSQDVVLKDMSDEEFELRIDEINLF